MPAPVEELTCPTCHKGPFMDRRALAGHTAIHEPVECDICGRASNKRGIGTHRASHGRTQKPRTSRSFQARLEEAPQEVRSAAQLLGRLATPKAVDRIREMVARLEVFPAGAFVVIGSEWGPHLAAGGNVAQVVTNAREACVVLPLSAAAELARLEAHRIEMAAGGGIR